MTTGQEPEVVRSRWVSLDEIFSALRDAGASFVALLRSLSPEDGERRVPGLTWTVAETAAHVVSVLRRALGDARRAGTLAELAALNAAGVEEIGERDPGRLADLLEADLATAATIGPTLPHDLVVDLHMGLRADVATGASYLLADLQVHGHDIASATAKPWSLDERRAAVTLLALVPAMGPWLRPEVREGQAQAVALQLTTLAEPLVVEVGAGRYAVGRIPAAATPATAAAPSAVLFAVSGRAASGDGVVDLFGGWFLPI